MSGLDPSNTMSAVKEGRNLEGITQHYSSKDAGVGGQRPNQIISILPLVTLIISTFERKPIDDNTLSIL